MAEKNNIDIWDKIYSENKSIMTYPDSILVSIVKNYFSNKNKDSVLDYGFGSGANLKFLSSEFENVSGIETSKSVIEYVKNNVLENADLKILNEDKTIPFDDNSFDAVIAWNVLCYNNEESLMNIIAEIKRVLKPGGSFIGTMVMEGDVFHSSSKKIDKYIFEMNIKNQEGARIIIPENESDLKKWFESDSLYTGHISYDFINKSYRNWLVSFVK